MTSTMDWKYRWKRVSLTGLVILLSGALAAGCSASNAGQGPKPVKTAQAAKTAINETQEVDADVVSSSQVNVIAKVGGDVKEIVKKRGDYVQQGDVILRLDNADALRSKEKAELSRQNLQAQLDKTGQDLATNRGVLKNTVEKLQLQLADQEKTYNNIRNDYDAGLASKTQLEKAETLLKTLRLDLDTAQKQLANLDATDPLASLKIQLESSEVSLKDIEKTLSDYDVRAPISGVLTDLTPEAGVTLKSESSIGVVQQLNPIKIRADLTESAMKLVRGKSEIPFTVQGTDLKMTGAVSYLAEVMSPQSNTFVLELSAQNPDLKLKSGMTVKLQLGGNAAQDAITVPISAIIKEGNDNFVFVVNGDQAEKRKVTLGRVHDSSREVTSGVKEGEQVVVLGQQELKDKDKITLMK